MMIVQAPTTELVPSTTAGRDRSSCPLRVEDLEFSPFTSCISYSIRSVVSFRKCFCVTNVYMLYFWEEKSNVEILVKNLGTNSPFIMQLWLENNFASKG